MANQDLEVFGSPFSQPSRAVLWFCKLQNVPHQWKTVQLGKGEHRTADYKQICYFQTVPSIRCGSYCLTESGAILTYLSRKHGQGSDWWPEDMEVAGRVAEYLSWHSGKNGLQAAGVSWVFPAVFASSRDEDVIAAGKANFLKALDVLETFFLARGTAYIAGNHTTVADLLAACDLAQIHMIDDSSFSLDKHLNVRKWFAVMRALPEYSSVHEQVLASKKVDF